MGLRPEIIRALLDPMIEEKRRAIVGIRWLCDQRAQRLPAWWAWTVWLAYGITVKRVEDA